jgi:NAD+ diphosphatase
VGRLTPDDLGLFLHATALTSWHETHPRCPRCGGPTEVINVGYARRCSSDGSEHYPRTDPAVIVLVLDSDGDDSRCLLGRQASWPEGRFSTLAGFVEPGETVEQAVAREVAEESGVEVESVAYAGSQPWPFPASLMLAYYAVAGPGAAAHLSVDGEEIIEARWFTRDQLRAATEAGEVLVPPRLSVARRLVEGWLGHAVAGAGTWR